MVTLSIEDVFKCLTSRTIPCVCATIASKELFECLIQFVDMSRNGKRVFKCHNGTQKRGIDGYHSLAFSTFFLSFRPFYFTLESSFNFGCMLLSVTSS